MYGVKVHEAVVAAGESETGCTIHFVAEVVDGGQVIAQERIEVVEGESAWDLGGRVFQLEGPLLVRVISQIARGEAGLDA